MDTDPITTDDMENHPINIARNEAHRLKEIARNSPRAQFKFFEGAAKHFHEAGVLSKQLLTELSGPDRTELEVLSLYYFYEEQDCLYSYHFERHDIPKAKEYFTQAGTLLERYISSIEQTQIAMPELASRCTNWLTHAHVAKRQRDLYSEAMLAREAWDNGQFLKALDRYRRMVQLSEQNIAHARTLNDPQYERIACGNQVMFAVNYCNALVSHILSHKAIAEVGGRKYMTHRDTCDIIRQTLYAYRCGIAASEINPEPIQYAEAADMCRRNVERFLENNPQSWSTLYHEFSDDADFCRMMAGLDHARFIAIRNGKDTIPDYEPIRILFLDANPIDADSLRTGAELRNIESRLRASEHRELFECRGARAVRPGDLQAELLAYKPHIVHYAGHSTDSGEIVLENDQGLCQSVPVAAFARLFEILGDSIRGVVLNSCGSLAQAKAMKEHVEFVIGMSDSIGDDSAIAFAESFYQGLGFGKSVKDAFELGRNRIHLDGLNDEDLPTLLTKTGLDPHTIIFAAPASVT